MINEKETIKKWHEMNPNLTTDQLLQLLDGIVEKPDWTSKPYVPTSPTITYRDQIFQNTKLLVVKTLLEIIKILPHGVMAARKPLDLPVWVRILVGLPI